MRLILICVSRVTDSRASFVHSQTSRELAILQTFRVLARDTHSSVNFELSCTVAICTSFYDRNIKHRFVVSIYVVVTKQCMYVRLQP